MKNLIVLTLLISSFCTVTVGQDRAKIERAALDYLEGFYEGDTAKIIRSIHPELHKNGYSIDKNTKAFKNSIMTYERAIGFAREVNENPRWAAPADAVKEVEILDANTKIANVKVTAYWGIDYMLMVKFEDQWMITKVLWQSLE